MTSPPRLSFDTAFQRLIGSEGGLSMDRADPGNWTGGRVGVGQLKGTKYGISAATYPDLDIAGLTLADAKAIYWRDWWLRAGGDVFDSAVLFQLWDFAINAGMGNAVRQMQRAVGVAEDGMVGPVTVAAVSRMDLNDFLLRFTACKIRYYTSLANWPRYGKGWMNRTADNLDYAAADNLDLPTGGAPWNSSQLSYPAAVAGSPPSSPLSPQSAPRGSASAAAAAPVPTPQPQPPAPTPSAPRQSGLLHTIAQWLQSARKP